MDFTSLVFIVAVLTYIGVLVYLANMVEVVRLRQVAMPRSLHHNELSYSLNQEAPQARALRWLLYGMIAMTFLVGLIVLQAAFFSDLSADLDTQLQDLPVLQIDIIAAVVTFILSSAAGVIGYRIITLESTRQRLQHIIGSRGNYNPASHVHTTAVILMLAVTVWAVATFVLQGGISGFAEQLEAAGIDAGDVVFQAVLQIAIVFLGVGLAIRRDIVQTLERLGLRMPTRADIVWGAGIGMLFILLMAIFGTLWELLTSPEQLAEQTAAADQISRAFATLPLAFIMAASAALGEEIWIRGALQPVFGILISSLFFVALHTQYTLTPATLVVLILSFGLGWLRQRQSTTAAIIAHFVFNFVPLALVSIGSSAGGF